MTREEAVLQHLNRNEDRIYYLLKEQSFSKANEAINTQLACLRLLNMMGYKVIEDPTQSELVEGYRVMKYIKIEDKRWFNITLSSL